MAETQMLSLATLPWRSVAAELPDPPGIIGLPAVKQRDVVVSTVRVGLQVQLLKPHLDHLCNKRPLMREKKGKNSDLNAWK